MPFQFQLDGNPPCGLSGAFAVDGEKIRIHSSEFVTTMDGERFVSLVEGFEELITPALAHFRVLPSSIDHLVAIFHPDGKVTVYCNELLQRGVCQLRDDTGEGIKAGQGLTVNNISEIQAVEFFDKNMNPILIPEDSGLIYTFSISWRKAMFFDLTPLGPGSKPREYDLSKALGKHHTRVTFAELYSAKEVEWEKLFEWGWFPFIGLPNGDRVALFMMAREGRYLQPHIEHFCKNFAHGLKHRIANYGSKIFLAPSIELLKQAFAHYDKGEWPASMGILGPRIEGIMRWVLENDKPTDSGLQSAIMNLVGKRDDHSSLFPKRFAEYLRKVHFKGFNLHDGKVDMSRNSHAHGVSRFEDYNMINATLQFLILDQIFFYLV